MHKNTIFPSVTITMLSVAVVVAITACSEQRYHTSSDESMPFHEEAAITPKQIPAMDTRGHVVDATPPQSRDPKAGEVASMDQAASAADIEIVAEVRRIIIRSDTYSSLARDVQIHSRDGLVTLCGLVVSMDEMRDLSMAAEKVPGVWRVDNQIQVAQ